ncbi:MAG: ABC-F family ATP-binding cassette domain-containing protein [Myxococcaceae bacterium]|nr:ABC-F family ATP-binding cassette domain-containing protein [Myxococcaceae bacterium]
MTLLRAADISLSFGSRTLFSGLELVIEAGERVGLVGINGSGKSTLMKVLAGEVKADSGLLQFQRGARMTYLPQEPGFEPGATVRGELEVAQRPLRQALEEHAKLSQALHDEKALARLAELSERIEALGGWDTGHEARTLLDRLGVKDWERPIAELSGGLKKRVAVAKAMLSRPELLMLDEPTNHLDAETTEWLEDELDRFQGALLLVTHDRYFLDGLVDRIVELSAQGTVSYPGNYDTYLQQKLKAEEDAAVAQHKRSRWIAQEVAWLRKGVEARRTKSRSRIERARKLMSEKGFVPPKVPQLQLAPAPRMSQTVIEAKGAAKSYGDRRIFDGVNLIVQPGERIGIVGPNGAGKTTLVRTLIGELQPDRGTVTLGPRTRVAYYDQQRLKLDDGDTVLEAAHHDEWVVLGDRKVRTSDYLDDLGFPVPAQRMKVAALSGGERNRLLLAKLFLEGANVLVLDEPTNDLDLVTLTVLEQLLVEFTGAVLLVTHDRWFLDKVATSILAVEGDGKVTRYEGNWEMYRRLRVEPARAAAAPVEKPAAAAPAAPPTAKARAKLSYKDQRELDGIEAAIEAAEGKKSELEAKVSAAATNASELVKLTAELERASTEVERLYARWQELQSATGS